MRPDTSAGNRASEIEITKAWKGARAEGKSFVVMKTSITGTPHYVLRARARDAVMSASAAASAPQVA